MRVAFSSLITRPGQDLDQHRTVCFRWAKPVFADFVPFVSQRRAWKEPFQTAKRPHLNLALLDPEYYSATQFADLVVTDSPSDIYGLIDTTFVQQTIKLSAIIERAKAVLDLDLTSWSDFTVLTREARAQILVMPITNYCMSQRRSEQEILGYKRMSWEEFSAMYHLFDASNRYQDAVCALPRPEISSFLGYHVSSLGYHVPYANAEYTPNDIRFALTFAPGEDGSESLYHFDLDTRTRYRHELWSKTTNMTKKNSPVHVAPADNFEWLQDTFSSYESNDYYLTPGYPRLQTIGAPAILRKMEISQYYPDTSLDLKVLTAMARDLGIKGYSNKTKSELCILVSEVLAEREPKAAEPFLICPTSEGTLTGIAPIGHDSKAFMNRAHSYEDYFLMASRTVSNAIYAPNTRGASAGRIPTDASFPGYYGVPLLEIL